MCCFFSSRLLGGATFTVVLLGGAAIPLSLLFGVALLLWTVLLPFLVLLWGGTVSVLLLLCLCP